ncbi:hypothetical protein WMF28_10480 [Sorangium sp. So ce590]|uniref:hypothetical protein n=1 Tax=Sorangium sp. So ce590 TaxID=3133317 RepID=UPI003F61FA48
MLVGLGARQAAPGAPEGERQRTGPRAWWSACSAFDKGVLAATLLCLAFSWLFVVAIMGYSQRFYYAPLPGLIYLACRSAARLVRTLSDAVGQPAPTVMPVAAVAALAILWLHLSTPLATAGKDLAGAVAANRLGHFNLVKHGSTSGPQKYWFALDRVSTLPDDLVMATTEVGMLGAMNLEKTIVDLAGLNDRRFALEPFSADRLFEAYKPELIYMPHPHYVKMIDDLGPTRRCPVMSLLAEEARDSAVRHRRPARRPLLRAIAADREEEAGLEMTPAARGRSSRRCGSRRTAPRDAGSSRAPTRLIASSRTAAPAALESAT